MIQSCQLCPRKCKTDRTRNHGFCGGGASIKVARAALHYWEEPCISGNNGSGTVFFSGCCLQCCFCQNYKISAENYGKEISIERLSQIFLELQSQGAHNINLVNPTHYVPWIIKAIELVKHQLKIPIVYNSGGYETIDTINKLNGYIDIYLPDLKYYDSARSERYSNAKNYFDVASKAIKAMLEQVGKPQFDENGIMQKGVIIRHMVMPKGYKDSIAIFDWIATHFSKNEILISLMSQYTPFYKSNEFPEINRRIFSYEYHKVLDKVNDYQLEGFLQEKSSAKEEYTPTFELQGI
ncbi:radical SAM protein [Paludicola sp. MB14-C6]|uniref:radical SAM protein n=1 Tax=Paludihabitans sp. MB14-C6 TaxID=3070656 RepID=UPI0027DE7DE5|nr:radical SAM protein [Paludicola sp. MB14-C6]WMJ23932.1 radical SAM protein [Paludicola sp. MB14-C6]